MTDDVIFAFSTTEYRRIREDHSHRLAVFELLNKATDAKPDQIIFVDHFKFHIRVVLVENLIPDECTPNQF